MYFDEMEVGKTADTIKFCREHGVSYTMRIYEVIEQYPRRAVASFWNIKDAQDYIKSPDANPYVHPFALPLIVSRMVTVNPKGH